MGSLCTEHIRSVHDLYQVTKGELFKVTMHTAHISSKLKQKPLFDGWVLGVLNI